MSTVAGELQRPLRGRAISVLRALRAMLSSSESFGSGILTSTGAAVVGAALAFVGASLVARMLGPVGRGQLAAIQLWPGFLATIALLGLPDAIVYHAARRPERTGTLLVTSLLLAGLAAAPLMLLGARLLPLLLRGQTPLTLQVARDCLWLIPVNVVLGLSIPALRARRDLALWNALRLVPSVAWLGVIAVAALVRWGDPFHLALGGLAAQALFILPVYAIVLPRLRAPFRAQPAAGRDLVGFGLPSMLGTVPRLLNLRLDQMVMVAFVPVRFLGLYAAAAAWSSAVRPLLNGLASAYFPRVALARGSADQRRIFLWGGRLGVLIALSVAVVALLLTPFGFRLVFGASFLEAVPAAMMLVCAEALSGVAFVLEDGFRGAGRPGTALAAELLGTAVMGAGLAFVVGRGSLLAIAAASALGSAASFVFLVARARLVTGRSALSVLWPSGAELRDALQRLETLGRAA